MFKFLIIASFAIGFVIAVEDEIHAETMLLKNYAPGDGHFNYEFDTSNGIHAVASGDEHESHGEWQYLSPEGNPIKLTYTADETGYHPHGDHLPTPPPMPEAIARALEYIKTHTVEKNNQ